MPTGSAADMMQRLQAYDMVLAHLVICLFLNVLNCFCEHSKKASRVPGGSFFFFPLTEKDKGTWWNTEVFSGVHLEQTRGHGFKLMLSVVVCDAGEKISLMK